MLLLLLLLLALRWLLWLMLSCCCRVSLTGGKGKLGADLDADLPRRSMMRGGGAAGDVEDEEEEEDDGDDEEHDDEDRLLDADDAVASDMSAALSEAATLPLRSAEPLRTL